VKKEINKKTQLKALIESKNLEFLMEAHNGLSASIAEEAGFKGIWGSGLSLSASLGVRDNNEASWTQVLDAVEYMVDATNVPILLDGDTGYGNFNNMRRLVKKCDRLDIAGVCIEDKIFPKSNSFLREGKQPLADIEEFVGKIKAGLDARLDDDFCIVARTEAFIAGWGLAEALKRAEAYRQAGATAILVHSKLSHPEEIRAFTKEWANRSPIVIVPTKYYATPTEEFADMGISTIIWANHLLRSSIQAMQNTAAQIFREQSLINVEEKVAPLKEVFRLQKDDELVAAEKKYFQKHAHTSAIILAASRGSADLGNLTQDKPKALLELGGVPLLQKTLTQIKNFGVLETVVVRGYKKEMFPTLGCTYINNEDYLQTSELYSLFLAKDHLQGELIIAYGDIVFKSFLLSLLADSSYDIAIIVDSNIEGRENDYRGDFVQCSSANAKNYQFETPVLLKTQFVEKSQIAFAPHGEWIGLMKTTPKGSIILRQACEELSRRENFAELQIGDLLNHLIQNDHRVGIAYTEGHWMDVDNAQDFERVQKF
jgi:phosphoenolpyruvate phosphomutase